MSFDEDSDICKECGMSFFECQAVKNLMEEESEQYLYSDEEIREFEDLEL